MHQLGGSHGVTLASALATTRSASKTKNVKDTRSRAAGLRPEARNTRKPAAAHS